LLKVQAYVCFLIESDKVEFILPPELYEIIKDDLVLDHMKPAYSRVILPLTALLEGDFFNEYIKIGMILCICIYIFREKHAEGT
jgi:hypothetical protein